MRSILSHSRLLAVIILSLISALLAVPQSPHALAATQFTQSAVLQTASNATGIATGDFGNGHQDIAVSIGGAHGGVDVFQGKGDGTFSAPAFYMTGAGARGIITGDFNNDGKTDLAVANSLSGTVSILIGTGLGTFLPAISSPTGSSPVALAKGHFGYSGNQDLAVGVNNDPLTPHVQVLVGNGRGKFSIGHAYAIPGARCGGAITNLIGDIFTRSGHIDLAVATASEPCARQGSRLFVLSGQTNARFGTPVSIGSGSNVTSLVSYPLVRDGVSDIIAGNNGLYAANGGVYIDRNNGAGLFTTTETVLLGQNIAGVAVGNFTGVQTPDIAAVSTTGLVTVFANTDHSISSTFSSGTGATGLATADFTGAGLPDLAILDAATSKVTVLLDSFITTTPAPFTATATVASVSNAYYGEEDVALKATVPLTDLHVTIVVKKSAAAAFAGFYHTFPAGSVTQSHSDNGTTIQFNLDSVQGQTIPVGTYTIGAQFTADGTTHTFSSDTYSATSNGLLTPSTGSFGV